MGRVKKYPPVKLIMGVTVRDAALWAQVQPQLEAQYSPVDLALDWYDFHHTRYYAEEMGEHLQKRFVSFRELIPAETLPNIKNATNRLETALAEGERRRINLDPGYLCLSKLVLATTKDYSHRVYLREGIFADIHLVYRGRQFQPQPWTYPDYREPFVRQFFEQVRAAYRVQLGETVF